MGGKMLEAEFLIFAVGWEKADDFVIFQEDYKTWKKAIIIKILIYFSHSKELQITFK